MKEVKITQENLDDLKKVKEQVELRKAELDKNKFYLFLKLKKHIEKLKLIGNSELLKNSIDNLKYNLQILIKYLSENLNYKQINLNSRSIVEKFILSRRSRYDSKYRAVPTETIGNVGKRRQVELENKQKIELKNLLVQDLILICYQLLDKIDRGDFKVVEKKKYELGKSDRLDPQTRAELKEIADYKEYQNRFLYPASRSQLAQMADKKAMEQNKRLRDLGNRK